jgi:uncharacterized protein (TIGR02118 family)
MYPYGEGKKFDVDYYSKKHIPMCLEKFGAPCKGVTVDQGLSGGEPGSKPRFIGMCHFLFDSIDAFQAAMAPHAEVIMGDVPNYTDIQPIIQISEVKM